MVVDRRILGHQLDRLFEIFDGARIIAEPVMRPAEAVDDVAVLGPQLHRLLDHLQTALQLFAPVDPRIAEIVEHQRLVGLELERMLEIGLGQVPLARALVGDAAAVIQRPVRRHAGRLRAAGSPRYRRSAASAKRFWPRSRSPSWISAAGPVRRFRGHRLELGDRLVDAVERSRDWPRRASCADQA